MQPQSLYSGLVDYWRLVEASGDAYGLAAGNQLTDTNTVTQADGVVTYARSFATASSECLTVASNANLQAGDIDFTFCCWVNLTNKTSNYCILSKDDATSGHREYNLIYINASNRFRFSVFRATDSEKLVEANNLGSPTAGTWYFISAWHDSAADTVNISVNASGSVDSAATTGALQAASSAPFSIGQRGNGSQFFNGKICEVGFWKRVLTQQERSWLYNGGRGRTYPFDGRPSPEEMMDRIPGLLMG